MRLMIQYGEDASNQDGQSTCIYPAISDDSDEIDHKFVYGVDSGGQLVELAHYASVKQVVVQNIGATNGLIFYIDNTTGALVPNRVVPNQHISFCDPQTALGIWITAEGLQELTEWHFAFIGRKD